MIVVADTSPLTALLHLHQLRLVPALYGQVYIPSAVAAELKTLPAFGYDISFLEDATTFVERKPSDEQLGKSLAPILTSAKQKQLYWLLN